MNRSFLPLLLFAVLFGAGMAACGGSTSGQAGSVTIEPLATATVRSLAPIGGKPAAPPTAAIETPVSGEAASEPTEVSSAVPSTGAPDVVPTATQAPLASDGRVAPTAGRWIDVDVTTYAVRLMDGDSIVREIAPVGVGAQVDTGEYASTQTGLFYVNSKIEELAYDPPYDTYISHWVGFDEAKANGFHSFLKDAAGSVVDASTGRVSNGCIRTGEPDAVFAYAEIGMPVWVHW